MFLNINDKLGDTTAVEDFSVANSVALQPEVAHQLSLALL